MFKELANCIVSKQASTCDELYIINDERGNVSRFYSLHTFEGIALVTDVKDINTNARFMPAPQMSCYEAKRDIMQRAVVILHKRGIISDNEAGLATIVLSATSCLPLSAQLGEMLDSVGATITLNL